MGYKYKLKNPKKTIEDTVEFKEILLWKIIQFLQESLPDSRPISIQIEKN